jgi:hypothetical protein
MLGKGLIVDEGIVGELERCPQPASMADCAVDGEAGTGTGDCISTSLVSGEEDMFGGWVLLRRELFDVLAAGGWYEERAD